MPWLSTDTHAQLLTWTCGLPGVVRMGEAPLRIEILTDIDGVEFRTCANRSLTTTIDGTQVPVISLPDLKANKRACGRPKDLDDLENLPPD